MNNLVSETAPPGRKFVSIDLVRGAATCMVALAHVAYRTGESQLGGQKAFGGLLDGLFVCVDFFFVLSGFLIAWVHWKDIGNPARLSNYIKRRLSRIYPVYWAVLILFIIGQMILPSTSAKDFSPLTVISSFILIPNSGPTLLGVAWTLYFEIIGYIVFAAILYFGKPAVMVAIAWSISIVVFNLLFPKSSFPLSFYLHPYHLQFLAGIAVAAFLKYKRLPYPGVVAAAGGILFLAMIAIRVDFIVDHNQLFMRTIMGLFACMAIAGLVEIEKTSTLNIHPYLISFGASSYSVYLVHTIVQAPIIRVMSPFIKNIPPEIWIFPVAGISIAVGYMFHRVVELPLTAAVQRLVMDRSPRQATP